MTPSKIPFNKPAVTGGELGYISDAISRGKLSGDGHYTKLCHGWLERIYDVPKALLTTSCTHALEMAALLLGVGPGDEVILPSFTFVSTANAFALRGARLVFVDVDPKTMNLEVGMVREALSEKTRVVVAVHYAGVSCAMDELAELCREKNVFLVEDAAQAFGGAWKGKPLGTFGALAALSFHETKNLQCGEGGALLINDPWLVEKAEIVREKGTDRSRFFRGEIDKYTWQGMGSSYLPSELNAAFLWAQMEASELIQEARIASWNLYHEAFREGTLDKAIGFEAMVLPENSSLNAHMFWLKLPNIEKRTEFINRLGAVGISAVFHYVPLHSAPAGLLAGSFFGQDNWTSAEAARLVRLPMYFGLTHEEVHRVIGETWKALENL